MPSFDIVSKIELQEVTNAVNQANREIGNRFDLKGTKARVEQEAYQLTLFAPSEFQLEQVLDVLKTKLAGRKIDLRALDPGATESNIAETRRTIKLRDGIDQDLAKQIVKQIKTSKIKVQATIQADEVRVNGKKRDDLQQVIALLKAQDLNRPLQFVNFRD